MMLFQLWLRLLLCNIFGSFWHYFISIMIATPNSIAKKMELTCNVIFTVQMNSVILICVLAILIASTLDSIHVSRMDTRWLHFQSSRKSWPGQPNSRSRNPETLFDTNFSTGSHSGAVSFRAIKNNYGHHDAFSFSMLYLGRDEADAVVVKETANDEM